MIARAVKHDFASYVEAMRNEPVYVILGVQGSGTNLLSRLLMRLFNFSVLRDRSIVFNAAVRIGTSPSQRSVEREIAAFERVVSPSVLRRKTRKEVIRRSAPFLGVADELRRWRIGSGAEFARLIYLYRAFSAGATHMAIKSDDIWENLHLIDEVISHRRIILITRDSRDNLLSVAGKDFGPIEPLCAAVYVKRRLAHYAAEFRRAGAAGYHVRFDTLVNAPRKFVDDFARHFQLTPTLEPDVAVPALQFRPNKIGKWKELSAQQLAWCEGILENELREFGYRFASDAPELPAPHQMFVAATRDKIRRVPQKVRAMAARMRR